MRVGRASGLGTWNTFSRGSEYRGDASPSSEHRAEERVGKGQKRGLIYKLGKVMVQETSTSKGIKHTNRRGCTLREDECGLAPWMGWYF